MLMMGVTPRKMARDALDSARADRFVGGLESLADGLGPEVSPDGAGDYTKGRV